MTETNNEKQNSKRSFISYVLQREEERQESLIIDISNNKENKEEKPLLLAL